MTRRGRGDASRWYRSFYWRIGLGFVLAVLGALVAQGVILSYAITRGVIGAPRAPNALAADAARSISAALAAQPQVDVQADLRRHYERMPPLVAVVMKDGQVWANHDEPVPEEAIRVARVILGTAAPGTVRSSSGLPGESLLIAPIEVAGRLEGVVVMPSPDDGHPPGILANVRRLLGLPAMGILVLASAVAALFIFGPAKRRLEALEAATERLGAGDLGARAPERGGDEIARVARAFNRMAGDLAAREQAIRTSDRLRRQMFADVSHELKTPLTAMRGYLETLRMKEIVLDAETRERYLQTVERETMRLETLVKDLLDLARYENFVAALDLRPFAAERLLALVMQRHEHEAGTNGITLRAEVTEAADQIVADPDRLEQALDNLVANALRHTPPGGTVTLSAAAAGDRLELTVADTGEGIPAEHLPHVFDRFYKVDSSRVSGSVGTFGSGLGLSIARAIVERHGGSIDVTSRPGDTRFTIVLPHALETA